MLSTQDLVEIRRGLHRIPELGFEEFKTQARLLEIIETFPQEHLEVRRWRTGLLVRVRGTALGQGAPGEGALVQDAPRQDAPREGAPREEATSMTGHQGTAGGTACEAVRTIGWRTDIDGLPILEQTDLPFASEHEGNMHACGHDMHMTIALGLLSHFAENPVRDNLLFVFQPAEEGPGGAQPMLASEEFQAWRPDIMLALHIAPEHPVGTIATRPGLLFANTSELFIDLTGLGGHAAYPHRTRDMVVAGAHLITQLQTIVSRNVDPLDSAVVTIGKLTGGTKQNIIAETARLEGTMRTLSRDAMLALKRRVEALVHGIEVGFECEAEIDYGANYMQVWNTETLTQEFMAFVQESRVANLVECGPAMTGEDFGYFLEQIPGFMFWLGVDAQYGLHHSKLQPHEEAIEVAVRTVRAYIEWKSR